MSGDGLLPYWEVGFHRYRSHPLSSSHCSNHYVNTDDAVYYNYKQHDDDFYNVDDDRRGLRDVREERDVSHSLTARETKQVS